MNEPNFEELVRKLLQKEISEAEKRELDELLTNKDLKRDFDEIKAQWEASSRMELRNLPDIKKAWTRFEKMKHKSQKPIWSNLYRIAASVTIVGLLAYMAYSFLSDARISVMADQEVLAINLPDGSEVWLNERSSLSYDEGFGSSNRDVVLSGEAFFEVEKNTDLPFKIQAGEALVQVLGTSFNVRNLPDEPSVVTTVFTGLVGFGDMESREIIELAPGNQGTYSRASGEIRTEKVDDSNILSWKTDMLIFRDENLKQVFATLERHFAVKIEVTNTDILNCTLTSSFKDPDIEEILEVIALSLSLEQTYDHGQYLISGKGCRLSN